MKHFLKFYMQKIFFLAISCMLFSNIHAQVSDTTPPYLKVPFVPPFKIMLTDSSNFSKANLPKDKPVVIIYLSPDCGHCKIQTKELTDSINFVKDVFFILTSYKSLKELSEFEKTYHLKDFDNIKMGRDLKYFLPTFYNVKFTPFVAVYDKNGKLLKAFEHGFSIKELHKLL